MCHCLILIFATIIRFAGTDSFRMLRSDIRKIRYEDLCTVCLSKKDQYECHMLINQVFNHSLTVQNSD